MRKNKIKSIFQTNNSLIYLAMSMMSSEKDTILPELLYTISRDDLLKLLTVFGGEYIYIPKPEEFKFYMNCAMAGYYYKCQKRQWDRIQSLLELSDDELDKVRTKVKDWIKSCSKEEIKILEAIKEGGTICE